MKKTIYDIYIEAHGAAVKSLTATNSLAVETQMLAAFNAGNNDPLDFDQWKIQFATHRAAMVNMQKQPSPSAAAAAAAKAALPVAPAAPIASAAPAKPAQAN